jgi:hypothetical protein
VCPFLGGGWPGCLPWSLMRHPFPCVSLCCCHSVNSASGKTSAAVYTDGGISNIYMELQVDCHPARRAHSLPFCPQIQRGGVVLFLFPLAGR